jgi:hypothetical protein
LTDLGSKKPLQLAHFEYEDAKIFGTKVCGGSLEFNLLNRPTTLNSIFRNTPLRVEDITEVDCHDG